MPMIFRPLICGRVVGFSLPEDTDLAVYHGRSLGVAALGISLMCYGVSRIEAGQPVVIRGLMRIAAVYVIKIAHVNIKEIQPLFETLEIGFWAVLFVLLLAVYAD